MTKVQLTLTDQETTALAQLGATLGYSLPKTIKLVLSQQLLKHADRILTPSVDPDFLEKYESGFYDKGDAAEMERARKAGELKSAVPFDPKNYL